MRDGLKTIARTIEQIVSAQKTLCGKRADILIVLRREGALGKLDRGIKRERRDTSQANLEKFRLLDEALRHAVRSGTILMTTDEDGMLLLGAPHIKTDVVAAPEVPVVTTPERLPLTDAQLAKLRTWGEPISV